MSWQEDQESEQSWWGTCQNTYGEETKQLVYAPLMGLELTHDGNSPYSIDMGGQCVVDIGGGPCSLLLKCRNVSGVVVDPCEYPSWVGARYLAANIGYHKISGEDMTLNGDLLNEVWIYNVLQHTKDPGKIILNAKRIAPVLRIFEWIDIPPHQGHPHMLTEAKLNEWIDGQGTVGQLNGKGECYGKYYAGAFVKKSGLASLKKKMEV